MASAGFEEGTQCFNFSPTTAGGEPGNRRKPVMKHDAGRLIRYGQFKH